MLKLSASTPLRTQKALYQKYGYSLYNAINVYNFDYLGNVYHFKI